VTAANANPELETDGDAAKRASGSSFYHAMRILPRSQRQAMFEIYSFCRDVDDIADDPGDRSGRRTQLQQWRQDIDALYGGRPPARLRGLAQAVREFALAREDFLAVVDGMEMDVESDIRAPDLAMLDLYCDRVASAVGHLSVRIFGDASPAADRVAYSLGRALQLTNILRDVVEDAERGRLYLPAELLRKHGIAATAPGPVLDDPRVADVCADLAIVAEQHFADAHAVMAQCSHRAMRPAAVMAAVYGATLQSLRRRGWSRLDEPVSLSKPVKIWLALRHGLL
jgi:presqualene diphosphate synthase